MRVLLIDADSIIPNIPLMKLSRKHKDQGDFVKLKKLNLPYFPNRKKIKTNISNVLFNEFDVVYCSVVFDGNKEFIHGDNIVFGGTGVDLKTNLSDKIEILGPDYSIYPQNNFSYGFITRGCIRNCSFCKVPKKEGYIRKVNNISNIVRHKKVKFLDNNILAYSEHKKILSELVEKKIKCQFNQGLDIRLIDNENSLLLRDINYLNEYIFAFDSWTYKNLIESKLSILNWRKEWQFKFFVYVHPNIPISDTVSRILWLKKHKCLPYIMRDITCYKSYYNKFYIDITAYCNQVHLFKTMNFNEFLEKRHSNKNRVFKSLKIWNENI